MKIQKPIQLSLILVSLLPAAAMAAVSSGGEQIPITLLTKTSQGGFVAPQFSNLECKVLENGVVVHLSQNQYVSSNSLEFTEAVPNINKLMETITAAKSGILEAGPRTNPDSPTVEYLAYTGTTVMGPQHPQPIVLMEQSFMNSKTNLSQAATDLVELLDKNCN